jgi:hypothetical protein
MGRFGTSWENSRVKSMLRQGLMHRSKRRSIQLVVGAGVNDPPPARSKAVIRPSLTPSLPADH